jgi:crossover junction endodeoxyribonuclease RuvC
MTQSQPINRIMGIDPGLSSTGVGVIDRCDDGWKLVMSDDVKTNSSQKMPKRLSAIHEMVIRSIRETKPDIVSFESIFFAKNVKSAVQMAHGRGVAILAAHEADIPVVEYSPLEIKQSVVGKGRASKDQVMQMVQLILKLETPPSSDHQADALACALAHGYRSRIQALTKKASGADGDSEDTFISLGRKRRKRQSGWR